MSLFFEEGLITLLLGFLSGMPVMLMGAVSYVMTALAIYVIARRRGLAKPWLAWVPVLNVWLLGSLSDQYQYIVKRQNRSKRLILLVLNVAKPLLAVGAVWFGLEALHHIRFGVHLDDIWDLLLGLFGCVLPLTGCAIAYLVIRYMALYDVYRSLDPDNAVLFLALSILMGVTEPFFLFFSREKDDGMPPRRSQTAQEPPIRQTWEETDGPDDL